jgi:RNA polymerase-binding transcription factor DksA
MSDLPVDVPASADTPPAATAPPLADLDRVERDLAGVETALERLDAGTYWNDEITGAPIDDETLANDPTARRNP